VLVCNTGFPDSNGRSQGIEKSDETDFSLEISEDDLPGPSERGVSGWRQHRCRIALLFSEENDTRAVLLFVAALAGAGGCLFFFYCCLRQISPKPKGPYISTLR